MKKIFSLLLVLLLLFINVGCNQITVSDETFVVGTTMEIETANRSEYNYDVLMGVFSQLSVVYADENGEYQPMLCDYETDDSIIWTFTIKDGMTWHDGVPVTAEDIKFTYEYLDLQKGGGYADRFKEINVINDKTVEFVLDSPDPRILSNVVAERIMPKHIYDGIEDYSTVSVEQSNIGCGPYRFVKFDIESGIIEFEKYDNYELGNPVFKTIIVKLYDNADTMYLSLMNGELDAVWKYNGGVDASVIATLEESNNVTLFAINSTANPASFIFNNNAEPFNDINVRKAVAYAIDYDKFKELFGTSYAKSANYGFVPQGTLGYVETDVLKQNIDSAKEYLKASGYVDTDNDGFVEKDGKILEINITLRNDKTIYARYGELVKNNLESIGIKTNLELLDVATFREITEKTRNYTCVITGLTAFGMAKNEGLGILYMYGENSMGYAQVYDADFEACLDQINNAETIDEYISAASDVQKYYAENVPAVALYWDSYVQAVSSKYDTHSFVTDGTFGILNVNSWLSICEK